MQVEHKIYTIVSVIVALSLLFMSLGSPIKVGAENYEPGKNDRQISVDKKVRSINEKTFYNNIETTQKVFKEGETIEFSIAIENSGKLTLNNIVVTDQLPSNLSLIFYPGTLDRTNNKIVWKIDELKVAEVKTYYIRAKIVDTKTLDLINNKIVKMTNNVGARSDTGTEAGDQASYYIGEGKVTGTIPRTGSSSLPIQTLIVLGLSITGFSLRKFVRGY